MGKMSSTEGSEEESVVDDVVRLMGGESDAPLVEASSLVGEQHLI